jgi:ubiquinone/menaquinone biosynthesis C-methylase UbiE
MITQLASKRTLHHGDMTENHPDSATRPDRHGHDYLPAAGRDAFLPFYDLLTRLLGMPKVYGKLIDQAALTNGMSVLEIGCGTGNLTARAHQAHPRATIVGVDPDPRALARAQRKVGAANKIRFERGYVQRLPFEDNGFDRVLSSMMWHHLDGETKAAAASEILRVLRPGGSLHLVDIGGDMTAADGVLARRLMRSDHAAGNLGDAIPLLFRSIGFDCTQVTTHRHRGVGRLTYYRATRPTD